MIRRYQLARLERSKYSFSGCWYLGWLGALCYPHEDLCVTDEERKIKALLFWLNERGAAYHIIGEFDDPPSIGGGGTYAIYARVMAKSRRQNVYLTIYDDDTAALMKLFFEEFAQVYDPVVVAEEVSVPVPAIPDTRPKKSRFFPWLR